MQPIIVHALLASILRLSNYSKKNKLCDDLFLSLQYRRRNYSVNLQVCNRPILYTVSQKCHYIFKSMWAIFCKIVTQYVLNQKILCFPPLTNASALPGETQKHKVASVYLNTVLLHCQTSTSRWINLFSYSQLMIMLLIPQISSLVELSSELLRGP